MHLEKVTDISEVLASLPQNSPCVAGVNIFGYGVGGSVGWREFSKGGKLKLAFKRNWDFPPIPPPASAERGKQDWHLQRASHVSDLWDPATLQPPTPRQKSALMARLWSLHSRVLSANGWMEDSRTCLFILVHERRLQMGALCLTAAKGRTVGAKGWGGERWMERRAVDEEIMNTQQLCVFMKKQGFYLIVSSA